MANKREIREITDNVRRFVSWLQELESENATLKKQLLQMKYLSFSRNSNCYEKDLHKIIRMILDHLGQIPDEKTNKLVPAEKRRQP